MKRPPWDVWVVSHLSPPDPAVRVSPPAATVPPSWTVRFVPERTPYVVDVEIVGAVEGLVATGFAVRSPLAESFEAIRTREVQRLPIATMIRAAIVAVGDLLGEDPGVPRDHGTGYYASLLARHRELVRAGVLSPSKAIADETGLRPSTVRVQLSRARRLAGETP